MKFFYTFNYFLYIIGGISGTLFREMAITLSITIVISTFTALSIAPMLGSKLLNRKKSKSKIVLRFEGIFKSFEEFYSDTLNYWIKKLPDKYIFENIIECNKKSKR